MMVLDKDKYIQKVDNLLVQPAYRTIDRDPTNKLKDQLILKFRRIKMETYMDEGMYKTMYPTSCIPPSFMGYQKSTKLVFTSGPLYLAGVLSIMGYPKS